MVKIGKNLFFEVEDVNFWEEFCEKNFKTKRVLSKVIKEAMDEYIENFEK